MKPDWMGDHLEDLVILSEGEMNYVNGIENSDPVSRVYRKLISSGQAFTTNGTQKSSMRLNFTFGSVEQLEEGIKRIMNFFVEIALIRRAL